MEIEHSCQKLTRICSSVCINWDLCKHCQCWMRKVLSLLEVVGISLPQPLYNYWSSSYITFFMWLVYKPLPEIQDTACCKILHKYRIFCWSYGYYCYLNLISNDKLSKGDWCFYGVCVDIQTQLEGFPGPTTIREHGPLPNTTQDRKLTMGNEKQKHIVRTYGEIIRWPSPKEI